LRSISWGTLSFPSAPSVLCGHWTEPTDAAEERQNSARNQQQKQLSYVSCHFSTALYYVWPGPTALAAGAGGREREVLNLTAAFSPSSRAPSSFTQPRRMYVGSWFLSQNTKSSTTIVGRGVGGVGLKNVLWDKGWRGGNGNGRKRESCWYKINPFLSFFFKLNWSFFMLNFLVPDMNLQNGNCRNERCTPALVLPV